MTRPDSPLASEFVPARHYTPGPRTKGPVTLLVWHATISPETPTGAESVAAWFARRDTRRASAHYCVDNDSIVQSVREDDVAWGAAGVNHRAIHLELVGLAAQTTAQWADDYSRAELELAAHLAADVCRRNSIPARWLTVAELQAGTPGWCTHAAVSAAFPKVSTGHSDPGRSFPAAAVLARTQEVLRRTGPTMPAQPTPVLPWLRYGAQGPAVDRLQRLLRLAPNGAFGSATRLAVQNLQRTKGLPVTGEVNPATWAALGVTQ